MGRGRTNSKRARGKLGEQKGMLCISVSVGVSWVYIFATGETPSMNYLADRLDSVWEKLLFCLLSRNN